MQGPVTFTISCEQVVCFVDTFSSIALYYQGFRHYNTRKWFQVFPPRPFLSLISRTSADTETNIPYWYRPHRSHTKLPVLFIHGIGIGLLPYIPFLRELAVQDPDVGIFAIEIMPISMHITAPPLASDTMCAAITRILNAHGLHRVVVAGHSYGTVVAAHLLRRQQKSMDLPLIPLTPTTPHSAQQQLEQEQNGLSITDAEGNHVTTGDNLKGIDIAATLLIDPIPFLLHHSAVAYNFVYRQPRRANEWQLWYFASRDADVARALSRHFFWFESILFREDVIRVTPMGDEDEGQKKKMQPPPTAVSLSGCDQIVDARAVHAYLTHGEVEDPAAGEPPSRWAKDGLEVLYFPGLDHATVFDKLKDRAPLLEILSRFVRVDEDQSRL
jgi:pimeloyl-ACP methyl ester carboxylesterase